MQEVREKLAAFPGMRVSVQNISLIGGGGFRQTPFNLILRGPDLTRLEQYAGDVIKTAQGQGRLRRPRHRAGAAPARGPGARRPPQGLGPRRAGGRHRARRSGRWSVARRSGSTARAASSTTSGCASRRRTEATPPSCPPSRCPARAAPWSSSPTSTDLGQGMSPGQIERYAQERSITIISNLLPTKPLAEAFREAYGAVAAAAACPRNTASWPAGAASCSRSRSRTS